MFEFGLNQNLIISHRLSASVVLFKTDLRLLHKVYNSVVQSDLSIDLYFIDNSPEPCIDPNDFPKAIYRHAGKNLGYGAAHNIAIKSVLETSVYHFVLNPDIEFGDEVLPSLIRFLDENPEIGQVMPRIVYPGGELQYLCKFIPTPFDLLGRKFTPNFLRPLFKARMDRFEMRHTGYTSTMDVPYLSGCFMGLRVECLRVVGLFDERFFMYPEDIDLTRRIAESYRTVFFPLVTVIHDHARESYHDYRMLWIHIKNIIIYFNKWGWFFDRKRRLINNRIIQKNWPS